jgi:hypothetical protein
MRFIASLQISMISRASSENRLGDSHHVPIVTRQVHFNLDARSFNFGVLFMFIVSDFCQSLIAWNPIFHDDITVGESWRVSFHSGDTTQPRVYVFEQRLYCNSGTHLVL